jgi:hypothetical protein
MLSAPIIQQCAVLSNDICLQKIAIRIMAQSCQDLQNFSDKCVDQSNARQTAPRKCDFFHTLTRIVIECPPCGMLYKKLMIARIPLKNSLGIPLNICLSNKHLLHNS